MALRRKFIAQLSTGPVTIPDPGQQFSPDEVRQMAAADYPELTSAAIVYHDPKDGTQEYGFESSSTQDAKTAAKASGKSSGPAVVKSSSSKSSGASIEFKPSIGRKG